MELNRDDTLMFKGSFKVTLIKVDLSNTQRLQELFCWLPQPLIPPSLEGMHMQVGGFDLHIHSVPCACVKMNSVHQRRSVPREMRTGTPRWQVQ